MLEQGLAKAPLMYINTAFVGAYPKTNVSFSYTCYYIYLLTHTPVLYTHFWYSSFTKYVCKSDSLTVIGTVCSTFSSCLKPIVIASTTTINELFTVARCCIVEVTENSCPAGSSLWLKSTSICCKR